MVCLRGTRSSTRSPTLRAVLLKVTSSASFLPLALCQASNFIKEKTKLTLVRPVAFSFVTTKIELFNRYFLNCIIFSPLFFVKGASIGRYIKIKVP